MGLKINILNRGGLSQKNGKKKKKYAQKND